MPSLSVSVVIPAFNEGPSIASVVSEIRRVLEPAASPLEILVVDDGSTDETAREAERAGAVVLRHPANGGYGKALLTGIERARHDWILMTDGDLSYPSSEIVKLLEFAADFDLVIGARTGAHFWGNPLQSLLRWIYLHIAGFVVGEPIPDANSGLRLVRRCLVAERGVVQCLGYSFTTTMTLSFMKAGRFIKFVPIAFDARKGKSKVKPARDILRTLQLMTQVMLAYNPLKLFVALAALAALAAGGATAAYLFSKEPLWLAAAFLGGLTATACFLTGCVLDSIRMHGRA